MKIRFYKELEYVFYKFSKNHTKILLGDFNAKVDGEDIFKPTIGSENLHETSNDNGLRVVKLCHIQKFYCQKYDVPTS
jgi:exonuclease III